MKLISSLIICLALSACATDYVSQLSEQNYGMHGLHYSEGNVDPTLLMNGIYASKQMSGPDVSGAFVPASAFTSI
jgi:type III secretory pathway lipoprotein EscJ